MASLDHYALQSRFGSQFNALRQPKVTAEIDSNFLSCRLTAVFRKDLLTRKAILIEVPYNLAEQSAFKLATYLQPKLEAAARGDL